MYFVALVQWAVWFCLTSVVNIGPLPAGLSLHGFRAYEMLFLRNFILPTFLLEPILVIFNCFFMCYSKMNIAAGFWGVGEWCRLKVRTITQDQFYWTVSTSISTWIYGRRSFLTAGEQTPMMKGEPKWVGEDLGANSCLGARSERRLTYLGDSAAQQGLLQRTAETWSLNISQALSYQ